jgi:predicted nucleotidyltransferase
MDQEQALVIVRAFLEAMRLAGYKVKTAFLFGSAARGAAGADSDIDVAVILDGISNSFDTQVELMKLRRGIDLRLEPHPFASQDEDDPSGFLAEVMRGGIRVA